MQPPENRAACSGRLARPGGSGCPIRTATVMERTRWRETKGRWDKGMEGRRYESEPSGTQKVAPTILSEPTRPGRRRARHEPARAPSHRKAEALGLIAQQLEIDAAIIVDEKHVLPVVPTLGHVVRLTRDNDSSNTTHAETLPDPPPMVKKYVTVPGCTARAAWLTHVPERKVGDSSGGQRLMLRRNGESLFPRRRGQDCNPGAPGEQSRRNESSRERAFCLKGVFS